MLFFMQVERHNLALALIEDVTRCSKVISRRLAKLYNLYHTYTTNSFYSKNLG